MSTNVVDTHRVPRASEDAAEFEDYGNPIADALREVPAWGISLGFHAVLLGLLGLITFTQMQASPESELTTQFVDVLETPEYEVSSEIVEELGSESDTNTATASLAAAARLGENTHREIEQRLDSFVVNPEVPVIDLLAEPSEAMLVESFSAVGTTENTGGTEGAIDRLTIEIAASLRERPTTVSWLFDGSLSLEDRRNTIAERFENIYNQLRQLNVNVDGGLETIVASFGKDTTFLTKEPAKGVADVVEAIRSVKADESGVENVFAAVEKTYRRMSAKRTRDRRNMMVIIVTDERGDDFRSVEDVIRQLSRNGVKTYCVGNAAVFGREKGYIRYTWKYKGETFTDELPVDQGPETVAPERLQLPFWTGRHRHLELMSSGYGPYALTRLCVETGGIYLIAEDSLGMHFDPNVMRNYGPDYRPIRNYEQQLNANPAKSALVRAARMAPVERIPQPVLAFRADTDTVLRQQLTEAQKPLANVDYHVGSLQQIIESGEKHRERLDSPRWKASYDLAMGRVLAMRVRALGYNAVLADMKSNPKAFSNEKNNQWRLRPSDEINGGSQVKRLHKKAVEYLNRVVDDHAGTPWAMLAGVELRAPMGWSWKEGYMQIAQRQANNNDTPRVQLANDEERRRQQQRRQQQKKESRPKL